MPKLNCHSYSLCAYAALKRRVFFAVLHVGVVFGAIPSVLAAPIKFGFEAEIQTVFPGIPFDSGIDFAAGDDISGQFTFNPNEGDGSMNFDTVQLFPFVFYVNGVTLSTPSFEFHSANDTFIVDFPPAEVIDSFGIGAAGLSADDPTVSIAPDVSGFRMILFGPANAIESAGLPANSDDWNRLTLRRDVHVTFRDGKGGAIGFQATIRQFSIIPEPSSFVLVWVAVVKCFIHSETFRADC